MLLFYRFNYKRLTVHTGSNDSLPVLLKGGDTAHIKFLGFIDKAELEITNKPQLCQILQIEAFSTENEFNKSEIIKGSKLLGCFLNDGLYCVIEQNKPIIIG